MVVDLVDPSGCAGNSLCSASPGMQGQLNPSPTTVVSSANIEEPGDWEDGERFPVTRQSARADWPSVYHQPKSINSCEDAMTQVVSVGGPALCTGPD